MGLPSRLATWAQRFGETTPTVSPSRQNCRFVISGHSLSLDPACRSVVSAETFRPHRNLSGKASFMRVLRPLIHVVKETWERWDDHNAPRIGASLSFYTLLSLAPLVV